MRKRILSLILAALAVLSLAALSGCSPSNAEKTAEAVIASTDGKYEFHGTPKGLAWVCETGKSDKLLEGSIKVREENSAITITLEGDIMEMSEEPAQVSFTYPVNGSDTTFIINRKALMDGLECTGVILNTAVRPKADDAGGGDMFSAAGMASGLLFWNDGRVQTMLLKIQSTHNYTYSAAEGLKIETTEEQLAQYGNLWVENYDAAAGEYTVGFDLTVPLPPFLANPGTIIVTDAQLQAGFGQ